MAQFVCRMALPTGEIVERTVDADSEAALRREFEDKDTLVLEVRRPNALLSAVGGAISFRPRIPAREFLFFNQEFSALLRAGLPILTSLDILIDRRKNPIFKKALENIRVRVKGGESLSEAFVAQGELFPKLYAASLASGERSGELPNVLKRYISYTRSIMTIQKKVVGALIYPAILVCVSIVIVVIMLFKVIPAFATLFVTLGTTLPWQTEILVNLATFLSSMWKPIAAAVVGGVVAFGWWKRTPAGRVGFDRLMMGLPLVGGVIRDYAQNRFTRTLSTLLAGGIPLVTSLELAARAVGNYVFEKELLGVTVHVREGAASVGVPRADGLRQRDGRRDGEGGGVDGIFGRDARQRVRVLRGGDRLPALEDGHHDRTPDARVHGGDRHRDDSRDLHAAVSSRRRVEVLGEE